MSELPAPALGLRTLGFRELGRVDYEPVWRAMQRFTDTRDAHTTDEIWLLEHPPVFTQGQAGKAEHVLFPGAIPVVQVDRGGQVTYHGPGQLVGYLLLDVRRAGMGVRELVTRIEQSLIDLLASYGVSACARSDAPGVYVDGAKIASLGLRIRRGCSFHGLALNVDMDLQPFQRINPCGMANLPMTQLCDLLGPVSIAEVQARLRQQLVNSLGYADHMTLTGGLELT
ncbi:lipoyl(octanoyl) transferase LipB [Pseudomonas sp. N040]|uniref:lipoyl(octanoyl) transferase LipB n=1 Tax=Pseudomonas sp. N040 TaxID=2785325 RepID=UPI0018A2A273|nr:lipoyl(octanoyl) transferase LipB [Pseudomonas sp. N040]MBF7730174.1 lipoyl(octanoyl) transferase LipB [Pseudomonas sp. N040]MBW7013816.1 lipoyl(octanoyl) transferase LipB [Pseudomonas sp. N040]